MSYAEMGNRIEVGIQKDPNSWNDEYSKMKCSRVKCKLSNVQVVFRNIFCIMNVSTKNTI